MSNAIVSRDTSKGLLVVAVVDGKPVATLAGKPLPGGFNRLTKPVPSPKGPVTHVIGTGDTTCALFAAEGAAIEAAIATARAAYLATPEGQRAELVAALGDGDAFPGSREWLRAEAARKALAAFDAAHPEVLAAGRAAHDAAIATDGVGAGGGL